MKQTDIEDYTVRNVSKKAQAQQLIDHAYRLGRIDKHIKIINDRLDKIDEHKIEKNLDKLDEKVVTLSGYYQTLVLKHAVLTEVGNYCYLAEPKLEPMMCSQIRKAFNKSDKWWDERKDLTIGQWRDELIGMMHE